MNMSKFNKYAREIDRIVKEAAEEFGKAKAAVIDAENIAEKANVRRGLNADTRLEASVADAKLQKAMEDLQKVKYDLSRINDAVAGVRKEFIAAVDAEYAAKPADIDLQTVELLRSGILGERDYMNLLNTAPNRTMKRLVADAFDKWVAGNTIMEKTKASGLRQMIASQKQDDSRMVIDAFDYLADAANRASRNDALFDRWNEIAGNMIENF
jgi:hypothetical protein